MFYLSIIKKMTRHSLGPFVCFLAVFALFISSQSTVFAQDDIPPPPEPSSRRPVITPPLPAQDSVESPPNNFEQQNNPESLEVPAPPEQRPASTVSESLDDSFSNPPPPPLGVQRSIAANPDPSLDEPVPTFVMVDEQAPQVLALMEDLTGKSIFRAQNLPPVKINFKAQGEITKREAILAIESLLALNGIAITEVGDKFLKAVAISNVSNQVAVYLEGSPLDLEPSQKVYTKLFTFDYLNLESNEVAPIIQSLISQQTGSATVPFNKSNSMLVTDSLLNLQRIEKIFLQVDKPPLLEEDTIRFYPIQFVKASDLKSRLDSMISNTLKRFLQNNTSVEVDDRTNQLIVVTHKSNLELIERMIESLDIDIEPSTTSRVFTIKHAQAVEVDTLLEEVINGQQQSDDSNNNPTAATPRDTAPPAPVTDGGVPAAAVPVLAPAAAQQGTSGDNNLQFSEFVTIVADERSNAIIVYGTHNDIKQIGYLIDEIDVQLAQVKINVVIVEINLSDSDGGGISNLALQYGLPLGGAGGLPDRGASIGGPGFDSSFSLTDNEFNLVLNAISTDSNSTILSSPVIITTHNQEAMVNISESRPVVTATTTSTVNAGTQSSQVSFRDIGIQLQVTPLIGANGVIQLEISQSVDSFLGDILIDGNPQPLVGVREAESFLSVNSGDVIMLAGLQSRSVSESDNGLYLLSDIPLLGRLFTGQTDSSTRTEIVMFIRPEIIKTQEDATEQFEEILNNFPQKEPVREYLNTMELDSFDLRKDQSRFPFFSTPKENGPKR